MEGLDTLQRQIESLNKEIRSIKKHVKTLENERLTSAIAYLEANLDQMVQRHPHYAASHQIQLENEKNYFDQDFWTNGLGHRTTDGRVVAYEGPKWTATVVCKKCDMSDEITSETKITQDHAANVFEKTVKKQVISSFLNSQKIKEFHIVNRFV